MTTTNKLKLSYDSCIHQTQTATKKLKLYVTFLWRSWSILTNCSENNRKRIYVTCKTKTAAVSLCSRQMVINARYSVYWYAHTTYTGMHIQPMSTNRSQTYGTQQITCRYAHIQYVQKNWAPLYYDHKIIKSQLNCIILWLNNL